MTPSLSFASIALAALLTIPAVASAQAAEDRVAFGASVHVAPGQRVRDAVAFGGDTVVEGVVQGDAVSFGGSVILREGARVDGDVTSFGGSVLDQRVVDGRADAASSREATPLTPAAPFTTRGPLDAFVHWVKDAVRSALAHALLFLLGLLLIGTSRERLRALQVTMIEDGAKTAGVGLLGYVAGALIVVLLALTIIGIPVAVLVGLALPVATYVGLAAAATVIGAALPLAPLKGKEVLQLAAGVGVLFLASLVPVAGGIVVACAACLGFGALLRTRFAATPPTDLPTGEGPFRTPAASGA